MLLNLVAPDNPILRKQTTDIVPADIPRYTDFVQMMFKLIESTNTNGIGLSAPQVGLDKSLFVISIDGVRKVFINPKIIKVSDTTTTEVESCLSLPKLKLKIKRPEKISVTWLNENNELQTADLEGLWARCFLHENDHLCGIMIDNRVSKLVLDMAKKKLTKKSKK